MKETSSTNGPEHAGTVHVSRDDGGVKDQCDCPWTNRLMQHKPQLSGEELTCSTVS